MANYRTQKVNHDIQRLVSQIIREEVNDPRVSKMCSVLRADVTKDLKHAKIYISTISEEHPLKETVNVLNNAAGFIKHRLSETMHTRSVPTLKFIGDVSTLHSINIAKALEDIQHDEQ